MGTNVVFNFSLFTLASKLSRRSFMNALEWKNCNFSCYKKCENHFNFLLSKPLWLDPAPHLNKVHKKPNKILKIRNRNTGAQHRVWYATVFFNIPWICNSLEKGLEASIESSRSNLTYPHVLWTVGHQVSTHFKASWFFHFYLHTVNLLRKYAK